MRLINRIADFAPENPCQSNDLRGSEELPILWRRRTLSLISRSRQIHRQITIWCALSFGRYMVLNLVRFSLAIQKSIADPLRRLVQHHTSQWCCGFVR
jgi:hypothetical protein